MNQLKRAFTAFAMTGLMATTAKAMEIQWATGCTSFQSPAVISVSYNTVSQQITLYRVWTSSQQRTVEVFKADKLNPLFSRTSFRSLSSGNELPVEFETKNSFIIMDRGARVSYFCEYYNFSRN